MKDSNKLIVILIILVVVLMIIMTLRILLPVASVSDKQTDEILNTAQNAKKQVDEEITLGDYVCGFIIVAITFNISVAIIFTFF